MIVDFMERRRRRQLARSLAPYVAIEIGKNMMNLGTVEEEFDRLDRIREARAAREREAMLEPTKIDSKPANDD